MIRAAAWLLAALIAGSAAAEGSADGAGWLTKMMTAAQRLSYSGTFIYQSGTRTETSRVVRVVDASGERERLEVLDGSPREVVRVNDEVRCYLPDERRVIVERRSARRSFPALLSGMAGRLEEFYVIRVGDVQRVAGVETRMITLDPKDAWRYGYHLWADVDTGLLIKARTVDERGQPIEQFAFSQISLGVSGGDETRSRLQGQSGDWHVEQLDVPRDVASGESKWRIRQAVPGFAKTSITTRRLKDGGPAVVHVVFSDGLAAVSLFIGPAEANFRKPLATRQGAVHVYVRRVGDLKITAVGEVPMATARRFAELVEAGQP